MSVHEPAVELRHPSLVPARGALPLADAHLTDRERLALLLQGAALLAHLRHAGWAPHDGWRGAAVAPDGRLVVAGAGPGKSRRLPQELLRELLAALFGAGESIAGRGEARRAARALLEPWRQGLVPLPPDAAVAQVLEAAPFLWDEPFATARLTLAAEHARDGAVEVWVAGPARFRRALLAGGPDRAALAALLASPAARAAWDAADGRDPAALARAGRSRAALAAWRGRPPRSAEERGLRLRCQARLGRLGAARAALRRLEAAPLAPDEVVDLAEIASRVLANSAEPERVARWVERALAAGREAGPPLARRAELVAAEAAWDRRDAAAMDRHLEAARAALDEPALAWRWHHVAALRALQRPAGDTTAVAHLTHAFAARRRLSPHEAAGLWNDLGLARAQAGDLAGTERAFRHAARLLAGGDGPRQTTLALYNLAEVRVRRGRLAGVREVLERSTAANRLAGNLRGLTHDTELWVRLELAQGRPAAALALCRGQLAELDRQGSDWRHAELRMLAARALGWLGRVEEAAAELAETTAEARAELEPEERPALWAHAGRREEALREAAGSPLAPLWQALLEGRAVPAPEWDALGALEPFRAARLVFDAELLLPGCAPPHWARRAVAALREAGAGLPAERLERRHPEPWRALAAYLEARDGERQEAGASWPRLLAEAGHPEAELSWTRDGDGEEGGETNVLAAGAGGAAALSAEAGGGRLTLRAPAVDEVLAALFALARRELDGDGHRPAAGRTTSSPSPVAAGRGGIAGRSPALLAAVARLERLAVTPLAVLVLGESGTGKELAARLVHRLSPRARAPFVAVNCAALSEALLLSDLFGHVRGSFTGADRDRAGVFETAQGGTVFLDEIGDLPPAAQGMLLRVLQEGEVRRVGESLARKVDVRVLAATHRDLAARVRDGSFREDLFYRLKVASVELPPLRARGDDVLLLAEHFLARQAAPEPAPVLSPAARAALRGYRWPGNVRELGNVLAVAAALADGGPILPEHLELPAGAGASGGGAAAADGPSDYHRRVDAFRRQLVADALAAEGGNRAAAARRLGLSRQALSYLARQLGIV
jgi:DNA-binding NtrC family response regulator